MGHLDPRATSWSTMMCLFYLFKLEVTDLCEKSQKPNGFLEAMQGTVWEDGLWCCFDPFSSVQGELEESSGRYESGCYFFSPPLLTHWIYGERRGGRGRWRKLLLRGDYSQRGALKRHPWAPYFFCHQWLPNQMSPSCRSNEIFLIDFPESLAGSLQIESCAPCIIINHWRLQGCRNWADVGKYVTDAWGQGKSSSYWPGNADLVCP